MPKFYRFWPSAPSPTVPHSSINGEIPARALQFCEPFLVANSVGWHIYPPIDFNLVWDGHQTLLQFEGDDEWILVDQLFLPDFADFWVEKVPKGLIPAMPVFLEAFPERGVLQLWTGYFASTASGLSLWIRSPVNQGHSPAYRIVEGIVETDWWAGPLFTNIEFTKTDTPVTFRTSKPLLQVIPIPTEVCSLSRREAIRVIEAEDAFLGDFADRMIETFVRRNSEKAGSYRRIARKKSE